MIVLARYKNQAFIDGIDGSCATFAEAHEYFTRKHVAYAYICRFHDVYLRLMCEPFDAWDRGDAGPFHAACVMRLLWCDVNADCRTL